MSSRNLILIAVVLVILVGGYLFISNRGTQVAPSSPETTKPETAASPVAADTTSQEATDSATSAREILVESNGLSFTPKEIRVKAGDRVKITYKNNKDTHNWALDEFNVKTKLIDATEQDTVEFVAGKVGTYEFYCSVPGHRQAGMKGSLIVE